MAEDKNISELISTLRSDPISYELLTTQVISAFRQKKSRWNFSRDTNVSIKGAAKHLELLDEEIAENFDIQIDDFHAPAHFIQLVMRIERGEISRDSLVSDILVWSTFDQPLAEAFKLLRSTIQGKLLRGQKVKDSMHNVLKWLEELVSHEPEFPVRDGPDDTRTHWKIVYETFVESLNVDFNKIQQFSSETWPKEVLHKAFESGNPNPTRIYRVWAIRRLIELFSLNRTEAEAKEKVSLLFSKFNVSITINDLDSKFSRDLIGLPDPCELWQDLKRLQSLCSIAPANKSKP